MFDEEQEVKTTMKNIATSIGAMKQTQKLISLMIQQKINERNTWEQPLKYKDLTFNGEYS